MTPRTPRILWLAGFGLGALWLVVVSRCALVWRSGPDYYHGWLVPFLALYLTWERWESRPPPNPTHHWRGMLLTPLAMAGFLVARFGLEPFPVWPAMLWLLALSAVVLSLTVAGFLGGRSWVGHFWLPVTFFATALPWPALIREPLTANLTGAVAATACALVNEFAGPAVRHGNIIEVGNGLLGVEEACAGIRSLESLAMIAVFAGEFFRLTWTRRAFLLAAGVALAIASNLLRTTVLAWIGATRGLGAAHAAHDTAGYAAVLATIPVVLLLAWAWRRHDAASSRAPHTADAHYPGTPGVVLSLASLLLLGGVAEAAPRAWFHSDKPAPRATALFALPETNAAFQRATFSAEARGLLNFDAADSATWVSPEGAPRAAYWIDWHTGHEARFRLELHNPRVCLPLAGAEWLGEAKPITLRVRDVNLPFHGVRFRDSTGEFTVFSTVLLLPDFSALPPSPADWRSWVRWRWQTVVRRERDEHVLLLTVGLWGIANESTLPAALEREVDAIMRARL